MNIIRRCRHGLMIFNANDQWQGRSFELYGECMESEINLLQSIAKPGWTVLDIGAGFGVHSVPLARFVQPGGKILAFEPERRNFNALCGNIAINNIDNAFCHQQAVGDNSKPIRVPEIDPVSTTNYGGVQLNGDHSKSLTYPVMMVALDDLGLLACDLIKIDVEGMELDVLRGAIKTIEAFRPVIYTENDGGNPEFLQEYLLGLGYEVYVQNAPLFNENNFYDHNIDIFISEDGARYVSSMLLCIPREKEMGIDPSIWGMANLRFKNSNCSLAHGGSGTTSLSHPVRVENNDYEKYLKGEGIDIGGGYDTLQTPFGKAWAWDVQDGDAMLMEGVKDNLYDFVYSAHCLEHLNDVPVALGNWCRILKPGGYFFVTIPDWDLYEQGHWPSIYNNDHKATFSTRVRKSDVGRDDHYHIEYDIRPTLDQNGVDLEVVRIEDRGYNYQIKDVDQTGGGFNALAQICLIGRKREIMPNPGHDAGPIVD